MQYSFIYANESFINDIRNFIHQSSMCDRARELYEKIQSDTTKKIKKLKDFYKQHRINTKTYKKLLAIEQSKLERLTLRLSNKNLLPTYY